MNNERLSDEDINHVTAIVRAKGVRDKAESDLNEAVRQGRKAGLSWATIGATFGITRQAAQQRWSLVDW